MDTLHPSIQKALDQEDYRGAIEAMTKELRRRKITPELVESFRSSARWMLTCVEAKKEGSPEYVI